MKRRSRHWLGAVALLAVAAAGAILANFALLDAAAGDEPVGKLSPLSALTGAVGETGVGTVPFAPAVTEAIPTESVGSTSETGTTTSPDYDRDGERGADDRDD